MSSAATASAAADIWTTARATGALSVAAYHRALETAFILDTGRAALARVRPIVARFAGVDADAGSDPGVVTAEALAAVRDARLVQIAVCAAGTGVQAQRRRAFIDPSVATPPALDPTARRRLDRLRATRPALDPAANPLVGALAGTPGAATRTLIETEPLFTAQVLSSRDGSIALDEVELLIDALHESLVQGFRHVVSHRSLPTRILARGTRVIARARRSRPG